MYELKLVPFIPLKIAEALLPSAEAEGSHRAVEGDGLQAVR
jgi:hypothetical protein